MLIGGVTAVLIQLRPLTVRHTCSGLLPQIPVPEVHGEVTAYAAVPLAARFSTCLALPGFGSLVQVRPPLAVRYRLGAKAQPIFGVANLTSVTPWVGA